VEDGAAPNTVIASKYKVDGESDERCCQDQTALSKSSGSTLHGLG
jgi:hypothetical protein